MREDLLEQSLEPSDLISYFSSTPSGLPADRLVAKEKRKTDIVNLIARHN